MTPFQRFLIAIPSVPICVVLLIFTACLMLVLWPVIPFWIWIEERRKLKEKEERSRQPHDDMAEKWARVRKWFNSAPVVIAHVKEDQ